MSTPTRKRLMRDFERLQQDQPARISGAPQDNNIMLSTRIYGCNAFDACNQEDATTLMELLWHVEEFEGEVN
ncbi:hypothetical protein ACFX1Q_040122 [Malus domestica]